MSDEQAAFYEDAEIRCDSGGLTIHRYYLWGAKRIPYESIERVEQLPLTGVNAVRRWRIWGSGDFLHWWNFDRQRPRKRMALVLDVGRRIRPTITPDDPAAVETVLGARIPRN